MAEKLTKNVIKTHQKIAQDDNKRVTITDSVQSGLVVYCRPTGRTTYAYRKRVNGYLHQETIAEYAEISLDTARERAAEILGRHRTQKLEKVEDKTLADVFAAYCADFEKKIASGERKPRSLQDVQWRWFAHVEKKLGKRNINTITQTEIIKLLDDQQTYASHNKLLTLMRSLFKFAVAREWIDKSPTDGLKKHDGVTRDRVLSKDEFKRLVDSIEKEAQVYQDAFWLLVLTGQRKMTVLSMEWSEIDFDTGVWLIPREKMKSKRQHLVPLTNEVLAILKRRRGEVANDVRWVLHSPVKPGNHISEKSASNSWWRRTIERAGLYHEDKSKSVVLHDLRRSLATWLVTETGDIQATSRLLAHSDISITAKSYSHLDIAHVGNRVSQVTAGLKAPAEEMGEQKARLMLELQRPGISLDNAKRIIAQVEALDVAIATEAKDPLRH